MTFFHVVSCKCCDALIRSTEIDKSMYDEIYEDFDDDMYDEMVAFTTDSEGNELYNSSSCCKECKAEYYSGNGLRE